MNYRDFEIARKKERTKQSHKAIHRKQMERPLSRPKAERNMLSNDPRMQKI